MNTNESTEPKWNLRKQRQEQVEQEQERNRSSHVHSHLLQNPTLKELVPMSNYEVAELRWENGQVGMHDLSSLLQTKSTWGSRSGETLESIVQQATAQSSGEKWAETYSGQHPQVAVDPLWMKKRSRSESKQCAASFNGGSMDLINASESTFCRASDNTSMDISWPSFESSPSFKPKTTFEYSASHGESENQDEDRETKTETARSNSSKRTRAAVVHNLSERRRRDRINQKMKALQKLVPNASKTDKASMLDEVIEYLKQLQAQVHVMNSVRNNMPQMLMSLGMQHHHHHHHQQQLQMSLLARLGMEVGLGMGVGMWDINATVPHTNPHSLPPLIHPTPVPGPSAASASTPTFVPPPFLVPSIIPPHGFGAANQSMNMELYNKMAALYQQVNQTTQANKNLSQLKHSKGDDSSKSFPAGRI